MLQIQHASYSIRGKHIVNDVSFTARSGRFIAIIGPNGAGKSTLLKLISGELHCDSGSVHWLDQPLASFSDAQMARERAVMTQQIFMSVDFPVEEVVLMGRYPHFHNSPTAQDWQAVREAMHQCGIEHLATRSYRSLSGGEQQRTQIARALAQVNTEEKHTFLLLDEPLNNLDIRHQHSCLELSRAYVSGGNTALMVMHDINLAALYADDILLMHNGRLLAFGNATSVLTEENLFQAYQFPVRVEAHPYHTCPVTYFGCPAETTKLSRTHDQNIYQS